MGGRQGRQGKAGGGLWRLRLTLTTASVVALRNLLSYQEIIRNGDLDFVALDLDFVAADLVFVAADFVFVAPDLDFVGPAQSSLRSSNAPRSTPLPIRISRLPEWFGGLTTPSFSIRSTSEAALL